MARYTGAVCRLCRREGQKLFLKGDRCYTDKCSLERRGYVPGMHGNARNKKLSEYGLQLREKQKARRVYGVMETQFRRYFAKAESQQGITVQAIPGCCAAVCALAVSGLPTGRFCFEGFLSANKKERRTRLEELSREERTMVFHEAPHKLRPTLADMLEVLGDRPVALCRELTKLHEETVRTTLAQAVALYQEKEPRGEYVLVVAGAEKAAAPAVTLDQGVRQVLRLRQEGVRMKDAVRRVAEDTGLPRNDLYNAALAEME